MTGGTSGLGLAMAAALAESGANVVVTGRDQQRAASVANRLPGAIGLDMDVRDEMSVERGVARAWRELGGIDLLVNNAGVGMREVNPQFLTEPKGFWTVSPDGFRNAVETNLVGYFLVGRAVTSRMLGTHPDQAADDGRARRGRIVNVTVSEATMRRPGGTPYGPSRAGSESLSRIMAADLAGRGITVNLLLPGGATSTGMVPDGADTGGRTLLDPSIMGRPIVWLASTEAAEVHDQRIVATEFDDWLSRWRSSAQRSSD